MDEVRVRSSVGPQKLEANELLHLRAFVETAAMFCERAKPRGAGCENFELNSAGDRIQSEKLFVATKYFRVFSSGVERSVHIGKAVGPIPTRRTKGR